MNHKTVIDSLSVVEVDINEICSKYGVCSDNLETNIDKFSFEDEDKLIELLNRKLCFQKLIYKMQEPRLYIIEVDDDQT